MTVSSTQNYIEYNGDGSTQIFTIPFYFLLNSDISVSVSDASGNVTGLTYGVDFSASGAGSDGGGTVTLNTAYASGNTILISREPAETQETKYYENGKFPARSHEAALDKLTMLIQKFGWNLDSLALKRPNFFSAYYDAQARRIANLADPVSAQDAVTQKWALSEISKAVIASTVNMGYLADTSSIALGDALIGVRSPLTGGAARTQHSKNTDVVTLEDFGAVGDGVTDDTTAIQLAINSGARLITSSSASLKTYLISSPLVINRSKVHISLQSSELKVSGDFSHFKVGFQTAQVYDVSIQEITFICSAATTSSAIDMQNVGLTSIKLNVFYGDKKMYNPVRLKAGTIVTIEKNRFSDCTSNAIVLIGTDNSTLRCVDTTIYDNRIEHCSSGIYAGDYVEGIFIRRNIIYGTDGTCISISPSSVATGLGSIKIQENDIDSYGFTNKTAGGIYIKNSKNIQVDGNWFASQSTGTALSFDTGVDSVVVSSNQFYPVNIAISVAGAGVHIASNIIVGGNTSIFVTVDASSTSIISNNIRGYSSNAVNWAANSKGITAHANLFSGTVSAFTDGTGSNSWIESNSGDDKRGSYKAITVSASPFTYQAGPRPEMVSVKGGTVTLINSKGNEVAAATNQTITLPPNTSMQVYYTGSAPGMSTLIQ